MVGEHLLHFVLYSEVRYQLVHFRALVRALGAEDGGFAKVFILLLRLAALNLLEKSG